MYQVWLCLTAAVRRGQYLTKAGACATNASMDHPQGVDSVVDAVQNTDEAALMRHVEIDNNSTTGPKQSADVNLTAAADAVQPANDSAPPCICQCTTDRGGWPTIIAALGGAAAVRPAKVPRLPRTGALKLRQSCTYCIYLCWIIIVNWCHPLYNPGHTK